MRPRAKIISSRQVFTGPVFGVRHDLVLEPDGLRATRDVVTHHGSVVVMPVFADGRVLLVRQYRHSVGCYLWELVAGRIEPGEAPLAAARRELLEETGYTARRFRKLLDLFPTPGFVSERFVLYAAEDLSPGKARPDRDERITWRLFRVNELLRWIRAGRLRDAKSVAGILYYTRFVKRGK
jgi:ADP-ribose pyrophosphatase